MCIVEQQNFDRLVSLLRCWDAIEGPKRRQLVDSLCSSLTCLNAWADKLLSAPAETIDKASLLTHRSAFKAYIFFLQWIGSMASREAKDASSSMGPSMPTTSSTSARGRKKKSSDAADWDWSSQLPKIMKSASQALSADLSALFRPSNPEEAMLTRSVQLATCALQDPSAAKDPSTAAAATTVMSLCALKYGQLESVTGALMDLINMYEHTPVLIAELLSHSVTAHDDGRLVAAVLAEIAAVDTTEYERQQNATGEKAGVRSVASFIDELACRLPKLLASQMSILLPHLGGRSWTLRSGIISASGHLIAKAFDLSDAGESQDAVIARLRSKQHLLDILIERTRDQSSFTRKAVLSTWATLAESRAVPLGHWGVVTSIAVGRLEDKSSLVRKEALRLLQALMLHNPFGPSLPVDRFEATYMAHRQMLDQLLPDYDMDGEIDVEERRKVDQEEDEEEEPPVQVKEEQGDLLTEVPDAQEDDQPPRTVSKRNPAEVGWDGSLEELQALVASLELAVNFASSLTGCMPTVTQLLASSTVSDVQESITFLLTCKQFEVDGAPEAIRCMLPLVFSRDQAIKDKIVEALDQLYVTGWAGALLTSTQAARALIDLATGASLGELGALEECIKEFLLRKKLTPIHMHELWDLAARAHGAATAGAVGVQRARRDLRASLAVLSMASAAHPDLFNSHNVHSLLQFGFDMTIADALTTRHACNALTHLSDNFENGLLDGRLCEGMHSVLTSTIVSSPLPDSSWFSAAEAAMNALYALHPAPEHAAASILSLLASRAFDKSSTLDEENSLFTENTVDSSTLSRFCFVLGQIALQHLVYIERACKGVRKARNEAEKKAAEESNARATARRNNRSNAESEGQEDEDINAELGVGSVAADAELDASKEAAEKELLRSTQSLVGPYARLVSALCHSRLLLSCDATLRASALLALSKLMVVDIDFCEANLQLLFTLLQNRSVEPGLRSNLIIALGDLALRFPNALEPWTEHIYRPLGDPDSKVRKNGLMVLTHLILNDMMKVKGHIAKVAVCLEDEDSRVSALARLFFHELAKKEYKGTSPIYNLLPDILSNLSREPRLGKSGFQSVMQQLLAYIKKDKQGDALTEKLCQRFAATEDAAQWKNIAFCLTQLPLSEKGLKKLADNFKLYKHALVDAEVASLFAGIVSKAKKSGSKTDTKQILEDLETKLSEFCAEVAAQRAVEMCQADDLTEGMADMAIADGTVPEERTQVADGHDLDQSDEESHAEFHPEESASEPTSSKPQERKKDIIKKPAQRSKRAGKGAVIDSEEEEDDLIHAVKMEQDV